LFDGSPHPVAMEVEHETCLNIASSMFCPG